MAAAAIGFVRVVEQAKAPHFALAEARLSFQPLVILAGVGVKARLLDLVAAGRNHRCRAAPRPGQHCSFAPLSDAGGTGFILTMLASSAQDKSKKQ
jgi:hypothetical protein